MDMTEVLTVTLVRRRLNQRVHVLAPLDHHYEADERALCGAWPDIVDGWRELYRSAAEAEAIVQAAGDLLCQRCARLMHPAMQRNAPPEAAPADPELVAPDLASALVVPAPPSGPALVRLYHGGSWHIIAPTDTISALRQRALCGAMPQIATRWPLSAPLALLPGDGVPLCQDCLRRARGPIEPPTPDDDDDDA